MLAAGLAGPLYTTAVGGIIASWLVAPGWVAWSCTVAGLAAGVGVGGALRALRPAPRTRHGLVRLMSWNVYFKNDAVDVAAGVRATPADIYCLFEVEQRHLDALAGSMLGVWTTQVGDGSALHDGIAVGGRAVRSVRSIDVEGMVAVRAEIDAGGERWAVWAYRPEAPTSAQRTAAWRRQLAALDAHLANETLPYVLAGDLNATVWHAPLHRLVGARRLRRAGVFRGGTWRHPVLGWRARIDHVYATASIGVAHATRGAAHGSDHRPLVCMLGSARRYHRSGA